MWTLLELLGPNEVIAEGPFRRSGPTLPCSLRIRVICYQFPGFEPQWLATSMQGAERSPAAEITLLYHGCWELETGVDELHTHTPERLEALLAGTPDRIRQERFALAVMSPWCAWKWPEWPVTWGQSSTNFGPDQPAADPDGMDQCVGDGRGSSVTGSGATDR